jgi:hypothetical protein
MLLTRSLDDNLHPPQKEAFKPNIQITEQASLVMSSVLAFSSISSSLHSFVFHILTSFMHSSKSLQIFGTHVIFLVSDFTAQSFAVVDQSDLPGQTGRKIEPSRK